MEFSEQLPDGNVNVGRSSPIKDLAVLLGSLLATALAIYWLLGLLIDYSAEKLTPDMEKALIAPFTQEWIDKDLPKQSEVIQGIADRLMADCADLPYTIKVVVVKSKEVNAVALPGGTILVFSGLIDQIKSENELAFVLGHELGHFKNKDHLRGIGRNLVLLTFSILLLGPDNVIGDLILSSVNLAKTGFSREQESTADAYALHTLQCRYQHIGGATDFFNTLLEIEGDPGILGHFFASHPDSLKRIQDINAKGEKAGYAKKETKPLPNSP